MTKEPPSERDSLSPEDMQDWLQNEISIVIKASELRIKEVTRLVGDYQLGKISEEEMSERLNNYEERWGEALPGVAGVKGLSDEQILDIMDKAELFLKRLRKTGRSEGRHELP